MGVGRIYNNTVTNLANHYKATGQIRPDVLPMLKIAAEKPEAADYEGLMDTMTQMAQSDENRYIFDPRAKEHHLELSPAGLEVPRFDKVRAHYIGDVQTGEIHAKDELGAYQTPERRVIEQEVFFAPDSIVAFNRTSGQGMTIDLIDRKDPTASGRFEIPAGSEWLTR